MSELILNPLSEKYVSLKCHSTADLLKETTIDGKTSEERRTELFNSRFLKKLHDKSQDTTAALVDLSNIILDTPTPDAIGLDLVRRVDMGTATKKVRIRHPGKAAPTGRGRASRGKGTTSTFIELKPEDEEESNSAWDLNFLEDADWAVAMEETAAVSMELQEKISQLIIDKLVSSAGETTALTSGKITYDAIVNARRDMMKAYVRPNALLTGPDHMAMLLKDDNFKNGYLYGDFVNKREGYIGKFLGMDIYESNQMPVNTSVMLHKQNYMLYAVRRDMMLESYEEVDNGKTTYGVKVSSRFEIKPGLTAYGRKLA